MNATDFKAIAELDLDPIKVKLMHVESGEGWSLERANAVEFEYRRFLYLMKKFPKEQTAPLMDVDIFWHYHILDTMKYAVDCQAVFGYFLHHFPYIGLRGEDDEVAHARVGQRMKELYEETFKEPYVRSQAAWSGAAVQQGDAQTAWSGAAVEAQTAWSGAAVQAQTAWSGAAVQAQTAWSGAAVQKETPQAQTAWSGAAVQAQTAWSGAAVQAQTAWSGAAVQAGAAETGSAWSGAAVQQGAAPAQTAWSGAAVSQPTSFYTSRPSLPQQA
ncbi:glycine-rich domain-containing protein-like [Massilia sp. erpn]|uniref:glycine-rich domain-containing protein-like n=1 Tax=Massilia sp. erpn TaxID=2738142 RepID=UPI0021044163|nr:glycine-rich domain-containing protein-like [Massilia sp. erpn]UTY56005.1 glycine-rich domain-containing protein-like [Massilia sp. erpn]